MLYDSAIWSLLIPSLPSFLYSVSVTFIPCDGLTNVISSTTFPQQVDTSLLFYMGLLNRITFLQLEKVDVSLCCYMVLADTTSSIALWR
jgi:hypothetical protein